MSGIVAEPHDIACVCTILRANLPASNCHVWAFGSRTRNTTKRYADLDLAVDLGRPLSQEERLALEDAFDASDLPYKVDILDLHSARPTFVAAIRKDLVALSL